MTSVTVITTEGNALTGRCLLKELLPDLKEQSSKCCGSNGDKELEVIRNVTLQSNHLNGHDPQLQPLKEYCHGELSDGNRNEAYPIQERSHSVEEPTRMDCDGGESTDGGEPMMNYLKSTDDGEPRMNYLKSTDDGEPRMKCLKSNPMPTTSNTNGTYSSIKDEEQTSNERTVDVYIWNIQNNGAMKSNMAKSCIPRDLIIVPIPVDGFGTSKANVEEVLGKFLDEVSTDGNSTVPHILFVDMHCGTTRGKQSMDALYDIIGIKQRHHCLLVELRHTVCTLMSSCPQSDYTCLEEKYSTDFFYDESEMPPDQLNTLLKENKILRFKVSDDKNYICTCPEKLFGLFRQATRDCRQWKVDTTELLKKMKMTGRKHIALAALASLGLIYMCDTNRSHVCIAHTFSPECFLIRVFQVSRQSCALRFTTHDVVDKLKVLAGCELLGWYIKKASVQYHTLPTDVFLLSKNRLTVLLWFEDPDIDGTSTGIYICEVNNIETSDRVRSDLSALRRCVGRDMTSFVYHCIVRESTTAEEFIQDCMDDRPDDWLAANNTSLYYKIDALALLRRWTSPSEEEIIENILHETMSDQMISKLSAIFSGDIEIFFIEQGVTSATVNQIQRDSPNFKMGVAGILKSWTGNKNNLYTLRKAIVESSHNPVSLVDFDRTVIGVLLGRQNASLL